MCKSCDTRIKEAKVQARRYVSWRDGARARKAYEAKTRVYVFASGETIMENLVNRIQRPVRLYTAMVLGLYPEFAGHMRWSQKAGCSCGCSPGFILDHVVRVDGQPADVFITITQDAEPAEPAVDFSYVEMALAA